MGIEHYKLPDHLNYFLCIEEDISRLSRWIEIAEANYECYSVELARILMAASAEVDVLARHICEEIAPLAGASGINAYRNIIVERYPRIISAKVTIPRFGIELRPWSNWEEENNPPLWWKSNNKVKHHRTTNFNRATLKNVLNASAALLILILLYHGPKEGSFYPGPKLFHPHTFGYKDGDGIVYHENLG
ncbi:hypothetical protein [Franzmannia qiaohouensis]|uniref:Uncharacterized protein n=1 Tax=Franzmannia qiaohouensis TaxID=1329370 RepID=A0ABU1HLC3_9GAMM|nr:hypothetical protein [Halomonas qiaohouensis]MDR5907594.1 hypothetical protein [Halomonas qiaohouensis]